MNFLDNNAYQNNYGVNYRSGMILDRNRPRKVVFYGRVSTEHEAQLSALENQMEWYENQTKYHSNWIIVNRYIDEEIIYGEQ